MIDLSKRPSGCFDSDSDPDLTTGGFLEPDSGLAGQSGRENRAGGARAGRASGADGVGLAGRVYLMMRGGAGWRGVGRKREGGPLGPHKGRLGASGGAGTWMDRGGTGGRLGALRALPGRCMQCPGGGSAHHAGIKKTAKRGAWRLEGRD